AALQDPQGPGRRRQETSERNHLQLVGPLRRAPHADRAVHRGGRRIETAASADPRRRAGVDRIPRQQFAGAGILDFGVPLPNQGRQGASARLVRQAALAGAARCADHEGGRLRHRILSLGRPVRAQGHAGERRHLFARGAEHGGARRTVQGGARQSRPGARVYGPARIRCILGRRQQAHRSRHPLHRQSRGVIAPDHRLRSAQPRRPRPHPVHNAKAPWGSGWRDQREGNGETVTLRSDHIAGGVFVAFGVLVFALSGDLPLGTLSFPGAGMMPKLVAGLLIVFGLLLVLRANESAPVATVPWSDLPHAARVVAITAAVIALYQTLGFLVTMALLLFALTFGTERRH